MSTDINVLLLLRVSSSGGWGRTLPHPGKREKRREGRKRREREGKRQISAPSVTASKSSYKKYDT